jgi:hypothetical protein
LVDWNSDSADHPDHAAASLSACRPQRMNKQRSGFCRAVLLFGGVDLLGDIAGDLATGHRRQDSRAGRCYRPHVRIGSPANLRLVIAANSPEIPPTTDDFPLGCWS